MRMLPIPSRGEQVDELGRALAAELRHDGPPNLPHAFTVKSPTHPGVTVTAPFSEADHPRTHEGKFAEKPQEDPGVDVLGDTEALVAEVIRQTGAPEDEARTAVAETSSLEAAVKHACQAATVRSLAVRAESLQGQSEAVRELATDSAIGAAVRRLLMRWPDANQIEMSDPEGDGNFAFYVFVDGEDVGEMCDHGLSDELWDLTCPIDYRRPEWFEKWCQGYGQPSGTVGLDIDRHTQTLDRAVFNLDLFRDPAPVPASAPAPKPPVRDLAAALKKSVEDAKARREGSAR